MPCTPSGTTAKELQWLGTCVAAVPTESRNSRCVVTSLSRHGGALRMREARNDGISDFVCERPAVGHLVALQDALQLRHLRIVALLLLLLLLLLHSQRCL